MAQVGMASLKDYGTAKRLDNELVGTDGTGACPYRCWLHGELTPDHYAYRLSPFTSPVSRLPSPRLLYLSSEV